MRLHNLCGSRDENLRHIETSFNVAIARRGGQLHLSGTTDQSGKAALFLQSLYTLTALTNSPLSFATIQQHLKQEKHSSSYKKSYSATEPADQVANDARYANHRTAYLDNIRTHDVTFGIGPAGSGKTFLAISAAVNALMQNEVKRIVLARPSAEKFCCISPYELSWKINPALRRFYDTLYDLIGFEKTNSLCREGKIEVSPLKYLRGRTFNHSFLVIDQAQNTTPQQMKTLLTRLGVGTRAVITGDTSQVMLPNGERSGLIEARQILKNIPKLAFTDFSVEDIAYPTVVSHIVKAYKKYGTTLA
ncbi:MAG: PhoH family protein [Rugosibacter sp.]